MKKLKGIVLLFTVLLLMVITGCGSEQKQEVLPTTGLEPTAALTLEPTATVAPEPTATATPEPTATATPEPTATATPEPTATATPEPTATPTPEPTATPTPEPTATPTPEPTATPIPAEVVLEDIIYKLNDDGQSYSVNGFAEGAFRSTLVIPAECNGVPVTKVANQAFIDCIGLEKVELPDTIVSIGDFAFHVTWTLNTINIPKGVTYIGESAFGASSIREFTIPEGVEVIKSSTFIQTPLTVISIPASVTRIEDLAFVDTHIEQVLYGGTIEQWQAIEKGKSNCYAYEVVCSDGTYTEKEPEPELDFVLNEDGQSYGVSGKGTYREASVVTIPAEYNGLPVTKILDGAFLYSYFDGMILPDTIVTIERLAFVSSVNQLTYEGTMEQWNAITKEDFWHNSPMEVVCTDGTVTENVEE